MRELTVDQVVKPSGHDGSSSWDQDLDERALEELGSVEENIGQEPPASGTNHSTSKVREGQLEGLDIVASDRLLLLVGSELPISDVVSVVVSVVGEPESHEGDDSELKTERPLSSLDRVGRVSTTTVEDDEKDAVG